MSSSILLMSRISTKGKSQRAGWILPYDLPHEHEVAVLCGLLLRTKCLTSPPDHRVKFNPKSALWLTRVCPWSYCTNQSHAFQSPRSFRDIYPKKWSLKEKKTLVGPWKA